MERKKRSESFFGMHFDFHARKDQTGIGDNSRPDVIERLITEVKPDYVQCDTKGHAGATSYPTKVGNPAQDIHSDILRMWRDITARHGVALYAHHSGVWDNLALEKNPSWAAVNDKGEPSKEKVSVFGPYADNLLIPQLLEMANNYGLDGAWVDGECWAVMVDYSEYAAAAYREKYGKEPPKPDEENYLDYVEFNRGGFRNYLKHYIGAVHEAAPHFQIASNWMYTSFVPEKVTLPVDFISGDYSPADSVTTARFESYCLINQPQPWDLMAWGFNIQNGYHCVKTLEQLCQEAAVVISVGGGFQVYNRQCVGTVEEWPIPMWAKLAEFCRARESFCHKARPVPQVGIVHSTKAFYHNKKNMFTAYGCETTNDLKGTLFAVLDNQYSAEVLMTHHIGDNLGDFGAVIVPNCQVLEEDLRAALLDYAKNGGTLILSGHKTAELFAGELGMPLSSAEEKTLLQIPSGPERADGCVSFAPVKELFAKTKDKDAIIYGYEGNDTDPGKKLPLAVKKAYGRGKILCVLFDAGLAYVNSRSSALRDFWGEILKSYENPKVRVFGSHLVEVALMEKNGQTCINLLNLAGEHANEKVRSFDEIPPLYHLTVELSCEKPPESVMLEPAHEPLPFKYRNGIAVIYVDRLDIHSVITVR